MANITSVEQEIATGFLNAVGDPFILGLLILMFLLLAGVLLRLQGEVLFILLVPGILWVVNLGLGVEMTVVGFVFYVIGGFIIGMAALQIIRR